MGDTDDLQMRLILLDKAVNESRLRAQDTSSQKYELLWDAGELLQRASKVLSQCYCSSFVLSISLSRSLTLTFPRMFAQLSPLRTHTQRSLITCLVFLFFKSRIFSLAVAMSC